MSSGRWLLSPGKRLPSDEPRRRCLVLPTSVLESPLMDERTVDVGISLDGLEIESLAIDFLADEAAV